MSTKKPVVVESYDETVFPFPKPSESFLARVQNHPAVTLPRLPASFTLPAPVPTEDTSRKKTEDTKDHPLNQFFMNFSEADELLQLAAALQQRRAKRPGKKAGKQRKLRGAGQVLPGTSKPFEIGLINGFDPDQRLFKQVEANLQSMTHTS